MARHGKPTEKRRYLRALVILFIVIAAGPEVVSYPGILVHAVPFLVSGCIAAYLEQTAVEMGWSG